MVWERNKQRRVQTGVYLGLEMELFRMAFQDLDCRRTCRTSDRPQGLGGGEEGGPGGRNGWQLVATIPTNDVQTEPEALAPFDL